MGGVLSLIATVAYVVLLVYFFALWARFLVDLVQTVSERRQHAAHRLDRRVGEREARLGDHEHGPARPPPLGAVLVIAEASFTLTDPAIKAVRRVLPPLRVGGFALDFGFTVVMFAVLVLMYVATALQSL